MGKNEDIGRGTPGAPPFQGKSSEEMMAERKATPELRVVDYLRDASADQLARLPDPWRPVGVAFVWTAPEAVEGD